MSYPAEAAEQTSVQEIARQARRASRRVAMLSLSRRNETLLAVASLIEERKDEILAANEQDCLVVTAEVEAGRMSRALFDRLKTSERGISQMAAQVRDVASLPDPLGRTLSAVELDDDLILHKVSCPLGVIGIIFESRPDVVPQVASLALKSGNSVILKGGVEAARTNEVLVRIWHDALKKSEDIPKEAINLLHTREEVTEILLLDREIDLIIPRGSRDFVRFVNDKSRIPVLGHGEGICHIYVDRRADLEKAEAIAFDSKVQYPAACNAVETLLVHSAVGGAFLPRMIERFRAAGVAVRGCPQTLEIAGRGEILPATEEDWASEYSDLIISIKIVEGIEQAIEHIDHYGSRHTETIVTEDAEAASHFLDTVDAAGVYQNASTRFADGYRYGLGAELGVSTGKLHARGPVGLEGLTTYKYKLFGRGARGHVVAPYARGERSFKHLRLKDKETV